MMLLSFRNTAQGDIMTLTNAGALTATSFSGNCSALTSLTYANITGTPIMTNYVLKAGDTMTGA